MQVLSFDEWVDMFHDTIVIYNQLIGFTNKIDNLYSKTTNHNDVLFEVRLNRIDALENTGYYLLKYKPAVNDWRFHRK